MNTASGYLELAEKCEREAATARSAENRDILLTVAAQWRKLAAEAASERPAADGKPWACQRPSKHRIDRSGIAQADADALQRPAASRVARRADTLGRRLTVIGA